MELKERQFHEKTLDLEKKMAEQKSRLKKLGGKISQTKKIHRDIGLAPKEKTD